MPRYWLIKSEPDVYSIRDLERDGRTHWEGVRNYQARNYMRDEMKIGDEILFYHSNADPTGVAGLARVARTAYPDASALDPGSHYFDPKATEAEPRWVVVDVEFVERFPDVVPLAALRDLPALADMPLLNRSRLSVQPVTESQFTTIVGLGRK
jgi:predicted RNA-binding protein with PUA-like domain